MVKIDIASRKEDYGLGLGKQFHRPDGERCSAAFADDHPLGAVTGETGIRAPGRETSCKRHYTSKALPFSRIL